MGGVVAVFLFRIDPAPPAEEWLWVVTGDLPSAYLVTDEAQTPAAALEGYCALMEDWATAVRSGAPLEDVFPVAAEATKENADSVVKRVNFVRNEVIPARA